MRSGCGKLRALCMYPQSAAPESSKRRSCADRFVFMKAHQFSTIEHSSPSAVRTSQQSLLNFQPRDPTMAPNLDTLPEELVQMIFESILSEGNELSLRLVNKALESKTFFCFTREFISYIPVTLTRPGIERLLVPGVLPRFAAYR